MALVLWRRGLSLSSERMQTQSLTFSIALQAFSFKKALLVTANEVVCMIFCFFPFAIIVYHQADTQ